MGPTQQITGEKPVLKRTKMATRIATLPYPAMYQSIKGEISSSSNYNADEVSTITPKNFLANGKVPIDISSQQGKFGWAVVGQEYLPFIQRGEESFCSVRMIESNILQKHFGILHSDIYSCTSIRSFFLIESEAELLTHINIEHCDARYGIEDFGLEDLIVKLEDVREFCKFLDFCYRKLLSPNSVVNSKCGFLRINGDSVIAYTLKDSEKYIPLFYFDGVSEKLKADSKVLDIWELAYLKFCCKIQGIKKEFLDYNCCSVVKLSDLKIHFPPETRFEEFWPQKQADSYLLGNKIFKK